MHLRGKICILKSVMETHGRCTWKTGRLCQLCTWERITASNSPGNPTGYYEHKTPVGGTMGPVGFTMGYLAQGRGVVKKATDRVRLSSVLQLPSTFHIAIMISPHSIHYCGVHAHWDCMLPFLTKSTPLHLHIHMVLERNPGRERGSPVGCSFVPVGCTDL